MENNTSKAKHPFRIGNYIEGQRCPACSSERDKGGRLTLRKKINRYLSCQLCRYSITQTKLKERHSKWAKRQNDRALFGRRF